MATTRSEQYTAASVSDLLFRVRVGPTRRGASKRTIGFAASAVRNALVQLDEKFKILL